MWTDLYRRLKLQQDGLRDEDFAGLGAQVSDFCLQQLDLLARPAAADLEEAVYDGVQIHLVFGHSWDVLRASAQVSREARAGLARVRERGKSFRAELCLAVPVGSVVVSKTR